MNLYLKNVLLVVPRILGQLDRNLDSVNYGCFDRGYWLHRTADFPSSACQQASLSLALLYNLDDPLNPYYKSEDILRLTIASIRFTFSLQHRDGSFDEWYPNERGWAGPTGYVIYSLFKAAELIYSHLTDADKENLRDVGFSAISFLKKFEEKDVLANHQAKALLAVSQVYKVFPELYKTDVIESLTSRWLQSYNAEGWSLEYDGIDPGYQTATLSFLARHDRIFIDPKIRSTIEAQLKLLRHFFYKDGTFAGIIGSRNTDNLFFYGIEYWTKIFPDCDDLRTLTHNSLRASAVPMPIDQEDHYAIYRCHEFLEAYIESFNRSLPQQSLNSNFGVSYYKDAGIVSFHKESFSLITNLRKGGAFVFNSNQSDDSLQRDSGWVIFQKGRLFTNSFSQHTNFNWNPTTSMAEVSGVAYQIKRPVFNPWKFVLFRIFCLFFLWNTRFSRSAKSWIRSKLMMRPKLVKKIKFTRTLDLGGSSPIVTDKISGLTNGDSLLLGGTINSRMVPQSQYFNPVTGHSLSQSFQITDSEFSITRTL